MALTHPGQVLEIVGKRNTLALTGAVTADAPAGNQGSIGLWHAPPAQASQSVPLLRSSTEVIRLVVMMHVRFPLSLRNVEDLLFERGIDISHETVRQWWNRFGPLSPATSAASG